MLIDIGGTDDRIVITKIGMDKNQIKLYESTCMDFKQGTTTHTTGLT